MAKYDTDEIGKPGKPPRARGFPWRLWLFAIAMTVGAGAGGYYAWQFRHDARIATEAAVSCSSGTDKLKAQAVDADKKKAACEGLYADSIKKAKELEARLTGSPSGATPATTAATAPATTLATSAPAAAGAIATAPPAVAAAPIATPPPAASVKWLAAIDEIQKQLSRMSETGQLRLSARRGSLVMSMPAETLFAAGSAELTKPGELAVLEVGLTIKRIPDRRFLIAGHTDESPAKSSPSKDSWELSMARALTVTRFLVQAGIDVKSLVPAGAGDSDPVAKDAAKNRRLEITLLPALGELPALPVSLGADTARSGVTAEAPPPPAKPAGPRPADPPVPRPAGK